MSTLHGVVFHFFLGARLAGARAGLPDPHRHAGRALSARRRRRRDGAHRRRQAVGRARPAGGGGQSRRRRGPRRHARGDQEPRPTATRCCSATPARSRSTRASMPMPASIRARISPPIGLIASMPVALIAHPSFPAKTDRRRDRAREEGQSRQIQYRHVGGRHRRLHVGRIVQVGRRHRCADRSLQGHRRRDERSARRPRAGRVRRDAARARQYPGRQAARHRGREPDALQPAAGYADLRGVRPAGLRGRAALRPAGARRHAARRSSTSSTPNCASWSAPTR